jgi:hypothetical protein
MSLRLINRDLNSKFNVVVKIPPKEQVTTAVAIVGTEANVLKAKDEIEKLIGMELTSFSSLLILNARVQNLQGCLDRTNVHDCARETPLVSRQWRRHDSEFASMLSSL